MGRGMGRGMGRQARKKKVVSPALMGQRARKKKLKSSDPTPQKRPDPSEATPTEKRTLNPGGDLTVLNHQYRPPVSIR